MELEFVELKADTTVETSHTKKGNVRQMKTKTTKIFDERFAPSVVPSAYFTTWILIFYKRGLM